MILTKAKTKINTKTKINKNIFNNFECMVHPLQFEQNSFDNKTESNTISRIAKYDFFLENELKINKFIQKDPFYYIFESIEKITYQELQEKQFELTNKKIQDKLNDKLQYVLLHYSRKYLYDFKEVLESFENNTHYIRCIIQTYEKILQSLEKLNNMNIIYNAISYESICFDNVQNPILFKFGSNIHVETKDKNDISIEYIQKHFPIYKPDYLYWPIEIHMLSYLLSNKMTSLSKIHIDFILEDVFSNNNILNSFDSNTIYSHKKEGEIYLQKYVNKSLQYIVHDVFAYKNTWDNYALSILFLDILLKIQKRIQTKTKNVFIMYFMKLLVENIHSNPKTRNSIKDTIEQFQKICYFMDVNTFKSLIKDLSK